MPDGLDEIVIRGTRPVPSGPDFGPPGTGEPPGRAQPPGGGGPPPRPPPAPDDPIVAFQPPGGFLPPSSLQTVRVTARRAPRAIRVPGPLLLVGGLIYGAIEIAGRLSQAATQRALERIAPEAPGGKGPIRRGGRTPSAAEFPDPNIQGRRTPIRDALRRLLNRGIREAFRQLPRNFELPGDALLETVKIVAPRRGTITIVDPFAPTFFDAPDAIGQPFPVPVGRPGPTTSPFAVPIPGLRPFSDPLSVPQPRAVPIPGADPFAPARPAPGQPFGVPGQGLTPFRTPGVGSAPNPLGFPSPLQARPTNCPPCTRDRERKKRERKPRVKCYAGSYREKRKGLNKRRREEIPCE